MILETIQPRSAPYTYQSDLRYKLMKLVRQKFVMNDSLNQTIYQDVDKHYLSTTWLNDLQQEGNDQSVTPPPRPTPEFHCLFQTFCFQSTELSTSLAFHNSSRTERSTPLPQWIPAKDRICVPKDSSLLQSRELPDVPFPCCLQTFPILIVFIF